MTKKAKFTVEFLKKKRDEGWASKKHLRNLHTGTEIFSVTFHHEDGKYYGMQYYVTAGGYDTFCDVDDDRLVEVYEVDES